MNRSILAPCLVEVAGLRLAALDPMWLEDGDEQVLCFRFPSENGAEVSVQVDDTHAAVTLSLASWLDPAGRLRRDVDCAVRSGRIVPVDCLAPASPDERVLLLLAGPTIVDCQSATELAMTLADLAAMPVDLGHPVVRLDARPNLG